MPMSDELGVLVGQQSSESFAGVPIKKRRFPIVRSPSPPPQIPSSLLGEVNGLHNEQSISEREAYGLSVSSTSVTTKDYSLDDVGGYSADGNLKLMLGNERYLELSLQQSIVTPDSNEKLSEGNESIDNSLGLHRVSENSSLLSAFKDPSVEGKNMTTDNSALERVSGNTELQLGFREAAGVSGEGQNSGESSCEREKLHVISLARENSFPAKEKLKDLALAYEKNNVQQTQANCNPLLSERSQWDLNTTMEAWEGSSSHSNPKFQATGTYGLDLGGPCDKKPVIFPSGMIHKEQKGTFSEHPPGKGKNSIKPLSSATPPDEGYDFKASLLKQLNPPHGSPSCCDQGAAGKSDMISSTTGAPYLNVSGQLTSVTANMNSFRSRTVKSEPLDVGCPVGCKRVDGCSENLVNQRIPKPEPFYEAAQVGNTTAKSSSVKSLDSRAVKSETLEESRQKCSKAVAGPSEMHANKEAALGISENVVKTSEMDSMPMQSDGKASVVAEQAVNTAEMTFTEGINPASSKSMLDEPHVPLSENDEMAEGYEDERMEKSADIQLDDPSNQNQERLLSQDDVGVMNILGKQQNDEYDYEDGELREPLARNTVDANCATGNMGNVDCGHSDHEENGESGIHMDQSAAILSQPEGEVTKTDIPCETTIDQHAGDSDVPPSSEKKDQGSSEVPSTEASTPATGKKRPVKATRKVPRDCSKSLETVSDQGAENQITIAEDGQQHESNDQREKVKVHNSVEDGHSNAHKAQSSVASEEVNKDVHNRGHRSRIINLTRTDDRSSSDRTKSTSGRSSSHRSRKEKQPVRSEKHPRGSRTEICTDGLRKFERERNENRSVGKTESDYLLVRGRVDKSLDALGGGRDSDRDYASERYPSTTDFRFHRHKKAGAFAAPKLECDSFVTPDGSSARAGGRPKNENVQSFRHLPLRRRSPGGRDGPMSLGMQMVHMPMRETSPNRCLTGNAPDMVLFRQAGGREAAMALGMQIPRRSLRDISPERRISGDGPPNLVVLKHEEKYVRGFPDMMDPLFARRQPHFQHVDNPFVRRERSLSPLQRRHSLRVPRGSKSPRRSHSPCQWSPHRRQSSAEFEGRVELLHGRPPPLLRVERMRPPQNRPCFPEGMMGRRRDSPPYIARLSNEIRDVGASREHDHHLLIHRSPSGRVSQRNSRRLDMMDPRERAEGDEYFGPHSGRVHELVDDGRVDERRKCGEGRGLLRPFRPPHDIGADAEAFPFHAEDGSRPRRICPEDNAEFRERAAPRDFDRHVKYRLGNPRIPRSIEQGENYGHGGQEWHDSNYDIIRLKKRRL